MNLDPGTISRQTAIRILVRWIELRDFPDRLLPDTAQDRGFVMDLVFGTVRGWRRLEWVLAQFVKRRPAPLPRAALLLGVQQILFMPDVADHAAVHATVEAAKQNPAGEPGFVNAVLRNVLRSRETLLAELARQPLAVRESHPDALVTRWIERMGADTVEALCVWNNAPAETVVAVLPHRGTTPTALLEQWEAAGVRAQLHPSHEACLVVGHGARVEALPGYAEGLFVPQDPSTLAAVDLLQPRPGERVLAACAAPGGKTARIAAVMQGQGTLVALERHADRLCRLNENLVRLGLDTWVQARQGDAGDSATLGEFGTFDRILLDAPCTNTGVLRRRPDARWRFTSARLRTMVSRQHRLLTALLPLLAPRGRLVYSTCSLEPEENGEQAATVCREQPGFVIVASRSHQPVRDGPAGAFACAIERKEVESPACSPA